MQVNLINIESAPDLVERVYASLLEAISDGTPASGARIMQEEIAEQLAARALCQLDVQLITNGPAAARGTDIKAMMTADAGFHRAIYAAPGNPLIAQTAQTHWHYIHRVMGATLLMSTMCESFWDEHESIAQAVARGDEDLAESLIRQHAEDAGQNPSTLLALP